MTKTKDISGHGGIIVREANTRRAMRDFVALPRRIYEGCPWHVPDLDADVRQAFDRRANACLEQVDIQPFVAYDADGRAVGRIAAILCHRSNAKWHTQCVRFGYLEFVDDGRVSASLLQAVEQWGCERGMTRVEGPMGIFDLDKEGMLIEDFHQMGSMISIYNHPYYPRHMEALGYEKVVDWVQVSVDVPVKVPDKYARVASLAKEMLGLSTRKLTKRDITHGGYGRRVLHLINDAYSQLYGYTPLTDTQIDYYLKHYLPIIDLQLVSIVENAEGQLVGVAITLCSLSHALHATRGRLLPTGWWHLLRALRWRREPKADMLLVAVRPDYQGMGVNALFFDDLIPIYHRYGLRQAETGPQLESNVRELAQWKPLHPRIGKRRRCYGKNIAPPPEHQ